MLIEVGTFAKRGLCVLQRHRTNRARLRILPPCVVNPLPFDHDLELSALLFADLELELELLLLQPYNDLNTTIRQDEFSPAFQIINSTCRTVLKHICQTNQSPYGTKRVLQSSLKFTEKAMVSSDTIISIVIGIGGFAATTAGTWIGYLALKTMRSGVSSRARPNNYELEHY